MWRSSRRSKDSDGRFVSILSEKLELRQEGVMAPDGRVEACNRPCVTRSIEGTGKGEEEIDGD